MNRSFQKIGVRVRVLKGRAFWRTPFIKYKKAWA